METIKSNLSPAQQGQFLQAAGMQQIPDDPNTLSDAQWKALQGILGVATAEKLRQSVQVSPDNPNAPALPPPKLNMGDWSNIIAAIAELQMKIGEMQSGVITEDIKLTRNDMEQAHKKDTERLKVMIEKMNKGSTAATIGKIFAWTGIIVGLVAATVATIATKGAAAPALILAVAGLGLMIAQETGATDAILDAVGLDAKGKMYVQIAITVAMLAASILAMICTGGASAASATTTAAVLLAQAAKIIGVGGQIVGAAAQIGGGAANIASTVYRYEAAQVAADVEESQAWLAKLQAFMSEEIDRLQAVIDKINSDAADASESISSIAQTHSAITSNMGV